MEMELTALHWIYVVFIALIIGFMVKRRDTTRFDCCKKKCCFDFWGN
ncbi:hypothetical protein P9443_22530 [Peribacillus frigoritolerans]|jgi:hypothetical protein|nr:hypothetical protein [Peribacillus frigoritolerans]MCY9004193.1 hypothetical protein [Peribacillus frigoritolerans]MED4635649.1 hypothetical protein [Peribacillus frigoritolerans]